MTTEQVAQWYGVGTEAIKSLVKDHRPELEGNGYSVLDNEVLRSFKNLNRESSQVTSARRFLAVFTRRAVLNVGMLLRDSEVARRVRAYLLNVEELADEVTREVAADLAGGDTSRQRRGGARGAGDRRVSP